MRKLGLFGLACLAVVAGDLVPPPATWERELHLVVRDDGFAPARLSARPGELLRVVLENRGRLAHALVFELPDGDRGRWLPVAAGDTVELTLAAPLTAGTFELYCPMEGHRELGETGTLVVTPRITR